MSVQAMTWVMGHSKAKLGDRLVILAIANHADARGRAAWPSVATIATETLMCERQVQRAIRRLEAIAELEVADEPGPHGVHRFNLIGMGDNMSPAPGDNMSGEVVTSCQGGGDKSSTKSGQDVTQTFLNRPKKEKSSPTGEPKKPGSRLKEDFEVPPDWIEAGTVAREKAHLPPVDLATEAIKFCNHFVGNNTANAIKRNWFRTWINWCLNAQPPRSERSGPRGGGWDDGGHKPDRPTGPAPKPEDLWPDLKLVHGGL